MSCINATVMLSRSTSVRSRSRSYNFFKTRSRARSLNFFRDQDQDCKFFSKQDQDQDHWFFQRSRPRPRSKLFCLLLENCHYI